VLHQDCPLQQWPHTSTVLRISTDAECRAENLDARKRLSNPVNPGTPVQLPCGRAGPVMFWAHAYLWPRRRTPLQMSEAATLSTAQVEPGAELSLTREPCGQPKLLPATTFLAALLAERQQRHRWLGRRQVTPCWGSSDEARRAPGQQQIHFSRKSRQ